MIGTPPSARKLSVLPEDPAEHASRFAQDWADIAESYIQKRMRELSIPEHQIGYTDRQSGIKHVFFPRERRGGEASVDGRINLDSGVLNPALVDRLGPEVSSA